MLRFTKTRKISTPCVLLEEDLINPGKLHTYGFPNNSPAGDRISFEFKSYPDNTFPPAKFELADIRSGLRGAPLLNHRTGRVCGIITEISDGNGSLRSYGIHASTIFTSFPELRKIQKEHHQKDKHWYAYAERACNFNNLTAIKEVVYEKVANIIRKDEVKEFQICLKDILEEDGLGCFDTPEKMAHKLTSADIFKLLPWLYRALLKTKINLPDQGVMYADIKGKTLKIIGWLILLAVNVNWFSRCPGEMYPEDFPDAIELPVQTETGIEIIHAALNIRDARFDCDESGDLYGRDKITVNIPENGPEPEDSVNGLKQSIYKYVFRNWPKKDVPRKFTFDLNVELNSQLQFFNEAKEARYLVVKRSESENPLNNKHVYEKLLEDLPDLNVIFQNTPKAGEIFQVSEIKLNTQIRNFFDDKVSA